MTQTKETIIRETHGAKPHYRARIHTRRRRAEHTSRTHTIELPILYEERQVPSKHIKDSSSKKRTYLNDKRQLPIDFAGNMESLIAQESDWQNKTFFGSNHADFYGLAESSMNVLSSNPPVKVNPPYMERAYRFLQSAYYGARQASIQGKGYAVPHEILIALNPAEILALNCAIYRIKVDGGIRQNGALKDISIVTIDDIIKTTLKVIHKAISEGDGFPGFKRMYHDKDFELLHGISLKERLGNLPFKVQYGLISTARAPYRKLDYDPGIDAVPDMEGVKMYKNQISSIMMPAYLKNRNHSSPPIFIRLS